MHEMSVATSLLALIREEMAKSGVSRLVAVRIKYGVLSNIVPESLEVAFELLTAKTELEGAKVEVIKEDAQLECKACGKECAAASKAEFFAPCPNCQKEDGYKVISGKGLYLEQIEVDE